MPGIVTIGFAAAIEEKACVWLHDMIELQLATINVEEISMKQIWKSNGLKFVQLPFIHTLPT